MTKATGADVKVKAEVKALLPCSNPKLLNRTSNNMQQHATT
jgi:hypothetical protein